MVLKLKAFLYRHSGVYLAHREENNYRDSPAFWLEFDRIQSHPQNDLSSRNIAGILIGTWQCEHGFYRRWRP